MLNTVHTCYVPVGHAVITRSNNVYIWVVATVVVKYFLNLVFPLKPLSQSHLSKTEQRMVLIEQNEICSARDQQFN